MEQWLFSWLWATVFAIIGLAVVIGIAALVRFVALRYPE